MVFLCKQSAHCKDKAKVKLGNKTYYICDASGSFCSQRDTLGYLSNNEKELLDAYAKERLTKLKDVLKK